MAIGRAAADGRNPVLAPHRRSYHDRLLVRYLRASTGIDGLGREEVAREPWGKVEVRLHAMLDLLWHVAKVFEGRVEVENGYPPVAYLLDRIETCIKQDRAGGDFGTGEGANDLPRLRIYRLHPLYSGRAWGGVGEHELVDQVVLAIRTLNGLGRVQDPHQEGRLLPLRRLLSLSAPRGGGGPEFPGAVRVVLGGAQGAPTDGDGTKHRSHHERHSHRV